MSVALSLSECARDTSETNEDILEKYLTGMKRKAERDRDRAIHKSHPKAKMRKYDMYVVFGFAWYAGRRKRWQWTA